MSFAEFYKADTQPIPGDERVLESWKTKAPGITEFMHLYSGCSFSDGLYRVHALAEIDKWTSVCVGAFPKFEGRILCFASNWLGDQFALNATRISGDNCLVSLFEAGTGKALKIPETFLSFHDKELVEDREAALGFSFFQKWRLSGGASPRRDQCVGYKQPLFLGGADEVDNLEMTDMEVYWTISAQLAAQMRDLPVGTQISGAKIV